MRQGLADLHRQPLGLPAGAMTVRNSDRLVAACPRRWWFRVAEGLEPVHEARALAYGVAWHAFLEDVHRWWMETGGQPYPEDGLEVCSRCRGDGVVISNRTDVTRINIGAEGPCPVCVGTGVGPIADARTAWYATEREEDGETLARAADGWLRVNGRTPPDGMRVIGVEVPLAFPIRSPASKAGRLYTPETYWVHRPDGTERLCRTGEAVTPPPGCKVKAERRPVYMTARLDCVWYWEGRGLMVGEWKSSRTPSTYLQGLSIDPQVTCYELALGHAVAHNLLWLPGPGVAGGIEAGTPVIGWWYDVSSSHPQRDPKPLKDGGFSRARTLLASVPSWRLRAAVEAAGLPLDEWRTEIAEAERSVDPNLYIREPGSTPPDNMARVQRENYALARERVGMLRDAAFAKDRADETLDVSFPRRPICRQAGSHCEYRGPCLRDSPGARDTFTSPERDVRVSYAPDDADAFV